MHQCPQNAGPKDAAVGSANTWPSGKAALKLHSSDVASCESGMLGHFSGRMAELPVEKATTSPQDTHFPRWWGNFIWEKRESRLGPNGFPQPHASLMIRSNIEQPHATMHCTTWTAQVTFPTSRFCQASLKLSGWNASRNHNHIMIGLRPSRFILISSRES